MNLIDKDKLIEILAEMQGRCATKAELVQNSKIWRRVKDMPTESVPTCSGCRYEQFGSSMCYSCARNFADRYVRKDE